MQTKDRVMRVLVRLNVLDPRHPDLVQTRTNTLSFVFLLPTGITRRVVPQSYAECLRYVSAERWHAWQGPSLDELADRGVLDACDR